MTVRRVICECVCVCVCVCTHSVKVCLYYVCMYVSINICVYMYAYIPVGMYLYVFITGFITLTLWVFISRPTFVSNVYPGTWLPLAQSQRMSDSLPILSWPGHQGPLSLLRVFSFHTDPRGDKDGV